MLITTIEKIYIRGNLLYIFLHGSHVHNYYIITKIHNHKDGFNDKRCKKNL